VTYSRFSSKNNTIIRKIFVQKVLVMEFSERKKSEKLKFSESKKKLIKELIINYFLFKKIKF
jgi:hypothetical protein